MSPEQARASYRCMIDAVGELVTIRRLPNSDFHVRARVTGYKPDELGGGIQQGDRRLIILAEDVTIDGGIRRLDRVLLRGRSLVVEVVDDSTRRVGGELIAYDVAARG